MQASFLHLHYIPQIYLECQVKAYYITKKTLVELSKTFCLRFSLNKGRSLYI